MPRKLRVFLCHASEDKPAVRELYRQLVSEPWIEPWLDEEDLLPGQDFDLEIYKAARDTDVIIICLSKTSVAKEGYVNKEIRLAYDIAQEKPEGAIYVIPLRLDDCTPSFEYLRKLHWADYFKPNSHQKLVKALCLRAEALKIETSKAKADPVVDTLPAQPQNEELDLFRFIKIKPQKGSKVTYPFWIGKYPVTNAQYARFLNISDFSNPVYWLEFPKFNENCERIGDWGKQGLNWLYEQLNKSNSKVLIPNHWRDDFGIINPNLPVVGVSWFEANAYCEWLSQRWNSVLESKVNLSLKPGSIRLPLEIEWVIAAGGDKPEGRFPWDEDGEETTSLKEILKRSNIRESGIEHTTFVASYPLGKSLTGVMDMAGNVMEWQSNLFNNDLSSFSLRGGSWYDGEGSSRVSSRSSFRAFDRGKVAGFRVAILPIE